MVCLRIISVDTLHKGDTENNNNSNNNISTMNSYIRIVATQCSLGTWFVSGI
jgi:hypothetical protein